MTTRSPPTAAQRSSSSSSSHQLVGHSSVDQQQQQGQQQGQSGDNDNNNNNMVVLSTSFEQEPDVTSPYQNADALIASSRLSSGIAVRCNGRDNNNNEDDDDDDGDVFRSSSDGGSNKTTSLQSFIHLLKGYVGPGCLSLPWAVSQLGICSGVLACFVLAAWSSYNCWTVVELKRQMVREEQQQQQEEEALLQEEEEEVAISSSDRTAVTATAAAAATTRRRKANNNVHRVITYPDVAGWLAGPLARRFTLICICVQQLAICTVFLSFVGTNLQAVLRQYFDSDVDHVRVITLALPAVMALSFLPNLKALAPVTAIGTALLLAGLLFLAVVVGEEWPDRPSEPVVPVAAQFPTALCAILYSFEGICLILPVECSMKHAERDFFNVFSVAMVTAAAIFAAVAGSAVAAFGPVDDGSVTAFLLKHFGSEGNDKATAWIFAANTAVSLSVLVTYPLQLFPCLELMGQASAAASHPQQSKNEREPLPGQGLSGNGGSPRALEAAAIATASAPSSSSSPSRTPRGSSRRAPKFAPVPSSDPEGGLVVAKQQQEATTSGGSPGLRADTGDFSNGEAVEKVDAVENGDGDGDANGALIMASHPAAANGDHVDDGDEGDGLWRTTANGHANEHEEDDEEPPSPSCWSRVAVVLLTYAVAVAVPDVQSLISLAGALAGSSTALLIPPALRWCSLDRERRAELQQTLASVMQERRLQQSGGSPTAAAQQQSDRQSLPPIPLAAATCGHPGMWSCLLLFSGGFIFLCIGTTASIIDILRVYRNSVVSGGEE